MAWAKRQYLEMAIHQSLAIIFNRLVMKVKIKNIYRQPIVIKP
jgi:hypothetical protein